MEDFLSGTPAGETAQRLRDLLAAAAADNTVCGEKIKTEDSPFWRRTTYRTVFSSIEALISHLKQSALLLADENPSPFTHIEIGALEEKEFIMEDNGEIGSRRAKFRFLPNLLFGFYAFGKSIGSTYRIVKDDGWDALTKSVKVRDRITHPKNASDFAISDQEMKYLEHAWIWFGSALVEVSSQKWIKKSKYKPAQL